MKKEIFLQPIGIYQKRRSYHKGQSFFNCHLDLIQNYARLGLAGALAPLNTHPLDSPLPERQHHLEFQLRVSESDLFNDTRAFMKSRFKTKMGKLNCYAKREDGSKKIACRITSIGNNFKNGMGLEPPPLPSSPRLESLFPQQTHHLRIIRRIKNG